MGVTSNERLRGDADLEMRIEAAVLEMLILRHLQDTKERWLVDVWIFELEVHGRGHGWTYNLGVQHTGQSWRDSSERICRIRDEDTEETLRNSKMQECWPKKKDVCEGGQKWQQERRTNRVPSPWSPGVDPLQSLGKELISSFIQLIIIEHITWCQALFQMPWIQPWTKQQKSLPKYDLRCGTSAAKRSN